MGRIFIFSEETDAGVNSTKTAAMPGKHLGVKDCGALSAVPIAGRDVKIIRAGPDGHAGGLQIVPLLSARQKHLADENSVPVEGQNAALPLNQDVATTVCKARSDGGIGTGPRVCAS